MKSPLSASTECVNLRNRYVVVILHLQLSHWKSIDRLHLGGRCGALKPSGIVIREDGPSLQLPSSILGYFEEAALQNIQPRRSCEMVLFFVCAGCHEIRARIGKAMRWGMRPCVVVSLGVHASPWIWRVVPSHAPLQSKAVTSSIHCTWWVDKMVPQGL